MKNMDLEIAPYAEYVMMVGNVNMQLSREEIEDMYQAVVETAPQIIETLIQQGINPRTMYMEEFSKSSQPVKMAVPVTKLTHLQWGDPIDVYGMKMSFQGTPEQLKELRKRGERTPAVFAVNDGDIQELIAKEIIAINPVTGAIEHGLRGAGPKPKSIQNNSER